jgi:hypothetical protein
MSTSQMTYYCFINNFLIQEYDIRKAESYKDVQMFRESIYGGRTTVTKKFFESSELFNLLRENDIEYETLNNEEKVEVLEYFDAWNLVEFDHLRDIDAVSLYPAAMNNYEYPIGPYFKDWMIDEDKSNGYIESIMNEEIIAICTCDVICPKDLIEPRLPNRDKNGCLEWNLYTKENVTYTSVDIRDAIECGYYIRIQKIIFWTESAPIFEEYIQFLFQMKKTQTKGTPLYLEAKLMMNGLYGKLIQRPYYTQINLADISQLQQFEAFYYSAMNHHITEYTVFTDKILYEVDNSKLITRDADGSRSIEHIDNFNKYFTKPHHLGSLVLSYSKRIMWEAIKALAPLYEQAIYYTDTDSIIIHTSLMGNLLHLISSQLGHFQDDLGSNCRIIKAYFISPKLYRLDYISKNKDGSLSFKQTFKSKGIPKSYITSQVYEQLYNGEIVTIKDIENNFNKLAYKVDNVKTSKGLQPFTIYKSLMTKEINPNYEGKLYDETQDFFYPFGHSHQF